MLQRQRTSEFLPLSPFFSFPFLLSDFLSFPFVAADEKETVPPPLSPPPPPLPPIPDTTIIDRVYMDFSVCPNYFRSDRTLGDEFAACQEAEPLGPRRVRPLRQACPFNRLQL
uniref:Uncharacterized protein n=1 Tax=Nelumbo nucifera TaxID=4432 RepID=A0A822Y9R6_NELNU|nr:TPA_asm: hypothetical protein HUJ06_029213 [Nelumbo nucifera]